MAEKICLDTDICISILKNTELPKNLVESIKNSQVFVTSVTLFELNLRKDNLDQIKSFLNDLFILQFDELAAAKASEIFKKLKSKRKMIEISDIFIASIAIQNNCTLATFNKKHFSEIAELELL